ncbi:MAG TPA: GNAT family N-acetyltransferase [Caulobacteraceae bacterium]
MTTQVIGAAPPLAGGAAASPCSVEVMSRADLAREPYWASAFAGKRKDRRYYELVEDTLEQGLEHRYFVFRGACGEVCAVQPFFLVDQDLVLAVGSRARRLIEGVRRVWPRFLMVRTLMVGCGAGEGHLDGDPATHGAVARRLAAAMVEAARELGASMIVLKEFPSQYRAALRCFLDHGFGVIPSMPMTRLDIDYADFDDYMTRALNSATRRKLRKKFREAAEGSPIEMEIVGDATPVIDEIFPLYQAVFERSRLHFERLTRAYFRRIGPAMPDKAKFFLWRQEGKIVAFALCMFEGEDFYPEYVGFDYAIAFQAHLYHYIVRDMIAWAIANGFKQLRSSGLNYDPKLHLRHRLDPIDLYVRHRSPALNAIVQRLLPWIEPTRYDPILKKFPNYGELWP